MNSRLRCTFALIAIATGCSATAQTCEGKNTATTLEHQDGSRSRIETDAYCNTHVETALPHVNGNFQWKSVGNYKDRGHSEVVKQYTLPGSHSVGSTGTRPGPVIQGPQPVPAPAPAPVAAPAPPPPSPSPRGGGGGGNEGGRGGGERGGGAGGGISIPSPGRAGDYGNQPGAGGGGGGGGGSGRFCRAGDMGACRGQIISFVPVLGHSWAKYSLASAGLLIGSAGLGIVRKNRATLDLAVINRAAKRRTKPSRWGLLLAGLGAFLLLVAGLLLFV